MSTGLFFTRHRKFLLTWYYLADLGAVIFTIWGSLGLRRILPGTYAVNGTFNVLFGGTGTTEDVVRLFSIVIVSILLSALIVLVKRTPDEGLVGQEMHHHLSLD